MAFAALREELTCSICLNIYEDPILLRCGHNFCRLCINHVFESQEASGVYTCPDCREKFLERPALQSNLKLSNITEHFHSSQPAQAETEIFCSSCIASPVPAVIWCLHCEVSLCDNHLKVHSKSQEHVLMEPCSSLRIRKCPSHQKTLTYYCCDENACICISCLLNGGHKEHQVININEAFKKKTETLRSLMTKGASIKEEVEEHIQSLQMHKQSMLAKKEILTEQVQVTFKDIEKQLDGLAKRILCKITRRGEQTSLSISDLIQQLDIRKDELSRKMCYMEKLCNLTDPLSLLQDQGAEAKYTFDQEDTCKFESVVKMMTAVDDMDENMVSKMVQMGLSEIMGNVSITKYFPANKAAEILLDVNTAANNVFVSGDLKTVSCSELNQGRPETPQRFEECKVLSTRSFTSGQHYWDMDTCKSGGWRVGVAYASVERRGPLAFIGKNKKSFGLRRLGDSYFLRCNDNEIRINHKAMCEKVRVYLDYNAGQVSFYELSDPITLLHTTNTIFTQPLHAVFVVFDNGWVRIRN
ncbi:E3 ubiquitin-protein ligase TRIM62-like [Hyla sarda]|uniref:E3 ubiquitin-protein ligase TRIM62-like n=1 Tax=Hyla sarda TaxID=327740 RepID=UPI0024C415E4|nr:E3 ubiquitin-protein ligase TRIM62-like [Hyla sarda]